jgi:hypothetical protein
LLATALCRSSREPTALGLQSSRATVRYRFTSIKAIRRKRISMATALYR